MEGVGRRMRMLRHTLCEKGILLEGKGWIEAVEGGGFGISILGELVLPAAKAKAGRVLTIGLLE